MNKPLLAALAALVITGAGAAPAMAAPERAAAPSAPTASTAAQASTASAADAPALKAVDFAGTVALSNCSGSVIRFPDSDDNAPALVLTNGHCLETGFPEPGEVIVDQSSRRSFSLLSSYGYRIGTLRADKVVYSTMTDTDVTIYETTRTYAQIRSRYGIEALTVADTHPVAGTAITVASGYWRRLYNCNIDGFAYRLKEGDWTWKDSVRYTPSCNTIGGTSGSPVIDQATGKVVAVNNTGNEDGETCTVNNPCEVDENGNVTVREGINYAQETYQIPACFTSGNRLDLSAGDCVLPKP
ncbi:MULTISPECIES: serine protease [unclassified Streptomyces]|uniref:S1 family peptidase n=1 Tax=unclassified Streptomyces TaxID=2593676 RepID=UPI001F039452|nr:MULTISPECIES: serine protease [unclassified Streptomyces]MCH0563629.1 trypsin-like peptidase domain-containing protein [Streptomyces sp. MUM 2J]MCH0570762.1 trypsin-like peptidase domain-containing protein [Streptomyces sp. MUM 136J]